MMYYPHMRGWSQHFKNLVNRYLVLPAHAGVILYHLSLKKMKNRITRTCGGDPFLNPFFTKDKLVLPAHAGVILLPGDDNLPKNCITRTCGGDPKEE